MAAFERGGVRIHYEVGGSGSPVLLVMGLGTPAVGWAEQLPAFRARHRTVAFDNRGCGRSGTPPGPWTIADMAEDAVAVLDHLGIERAHLVGISMGGMIAQEIAIARPERVGALVLASTYAAPDEHVSRVAKRAVEIFAGGDGQRVFAAFQYLLEITFSKDYLAREGLRIVQLMAEGLPDGPNLPGLAAQAVAALAFDARERASRIRAPALVLTGDADAFIWPSCSEDLAARIPGARLALIPGGTHAANLERAAEWNAIVLDFLAAHEDALGAGAREPAGAAAARAGV